MGRSTLYYITLHYIASRHVTLHFFTLHRPNWFRLCQPAWATLPPWLVSKGKRITNIHSPTKLEEEEEKSGKRGGGKTKTRKTNALHSKGFCCQRVCVSLTPCVWSHCEYHRRRRRNKWWMGMGAAVVSFWYGVIGDRSFSVKSLASTPKRTEV